MDLENWVRTKLKSCLEYEVPEEMVSFIMRIKEEHEIDDLRNILDVTKEKDALFLNELKLKLFPKKSLALQSQSNSKAVIPVNNAKSKKYEKKQKQETKKLEPEVQKETGTKRKQKFYNFYGQDGQLNDVVLLKGRHRCECQAGKHKLINNCLKCGRIVCEQEGSGPCLFCGALVCSEDEQKLINSQTKKGENLKKALLDQSRPKGWQEAISQRDRLLRYDQESERRTTVIDDESDYFKANSVWLSDAERKKLEKLEHQMQDKKHESRLTKKMTFDFAGRQVVEDQDKEKEEEILRQAMEITEKAAFSNTIDPNLEYNPPQFDTSVKSQFPNLKKPHGNFDGVFSKVQDQEFLEMSDLKNCLSMHQPYASLLVAGIKKYNLIRSFLVYPYLIEFF